MRRILILEDDREFRSELAEALEAAPFEVEEAGTVAEYWEKHNANPPHVALLDMSLPDGRGMEVARDIRRASDIAILFLSGMDDEIDRIVALEVGADDFVRKPCNPRELIARINAVLRRGGPTPATGPGSPAPDAGGKHDTRRFEGFTLDLAAMELHGPDGEQVSLTTAEFDLLKIFAERPRRVLSRDTLLDLLRGHDWAGYDRTVDGLVSRLRKKLSVDGTPCPFLKTVRGAGYILSTGVERG